MTFSKEDLLPYVHLDKGLKTPDRLKTMLMQHAMLDKSTQEMAGLVTEIHPSTLFSMSLLDMEATGGGLDDFLLIPKDFSFVFEQGVNGSGAETKRWAERQAELQLPLIWLGQTTNHSMKIQVEKLLDEELKGSSVPGNLWMNKSILTKALRLVDFRLKQHIGRGISKHADFDTNPSKYEFMVIMHRLIARSSSTTSLAKLYFSYNAPFHCFERILQDETQLCHIPETNHSSNLPEPVVHSQEASKLQDSSPGISNRAVPTPTGSLTMASALPNSTYSAYGSTWAKAHHSHIRKKKGYTVKDGPWKCRIVCQNKEMPKLENYDVVDEKSYFQLVCKVQNYNKLYPDDNYFVVIMHSKERAIWDKVQNKKATDQRDARQLSMDNAGIDEHEDGSGESYFEWVCRSNPSQ